MKRRHPCEGHACDDCAICRRGRCCAQAAADRRIRGAMAWWLQDGLSEDAHSHNSLLQDLAEDAHRTATRASVSESESPGSGSELRDVHDLPRSALPPGEALLAHLSLAALLEQQPAEERKP